MLIKTLTVTGADDSVTDFEEMRALAQKYPFIEFGILMSPGRMGTTRYPSAKWIEGLAEAGLLGKCCAHLCGEFSRDVLRGETPRALRDLEYRFGAFPRLQINFNGRESYDLTALRLFVLDRISTYDGEVILQNRATTYHVLYALLSTETPISILYDESGGREVTPIAWPFPADEIFNIARRIGYAGGLQPGGPKLQQQLEAIRHALEDRYDPTPLDERIISIDMESSLRIPHPNGAFSLEQCAAAAEGVELWHRIRKDKKRDVEGRAVTHGRMLLHKDEEALVQLVLPMGSISYIVRDDFENGGAVITFEIVSADPISVKDLQDMFRPDPKTEPYHFGRGETVTAEFNLHNRYGYQYAIDRHEIRFGTLGLETAIRITLENVMRAMAKPLIEKATEATVMALRRRDTYTPAYPGHVWNRPSRDIVDEPSANCGKILHNSFLQGFIPPKRDANKDRAAAAAGYVKLYRNKLRWAKRPGTTRGRRHLRQRRQQRKRG